MESKSRTISKSFPACVPTFGRKKNTPTLKQTGISLCLFLLVFSLVSACDSTNSGDSEPALEEYFKADINGDRFIKERDGTKPVMEDYAFMITDEGQDRLSISVDSLSFPYVFSMAISLFPPEGIYDTTYTIQSDIYDFQNAWASVSELDWDVFISQYNPVEGENNVLEIRNSILDDGRMLVEGSFRMTMARDSSYQNSGSVVVDTQLSDTLSITNGSFRVIVKDLR